MKQDPKLTPVHPWEYPEGPWRQVHLDFAGPFEGKTFLIMVDTHRLARSISDDKHNNRGHH